MSPYLELLKPLNVLFSYAIPLALWGAPLLWRYVNRRPVTRRQVEYAAWIVASTGFWILFGNAAVDAHKHGMISELASVISAIVVTAIAIGSMHLIDRRYRQEDLEESKS
jgi:hypothetical protein